MIKGLLFLASLGPLAWLALNGYAENLGANPIEVITRTTGTWTLVFLLITLSIIPLRKFSDRTARLACPQWLCRKPGRQSHRGHHPHHRHLDSGISLNNSQHHSAAQILRSDRSLGLPSMAMPKTWAPIPSRSSPAPPAPGLWYFS